jgi:opacity protein-like surface antigen
MKNPVKFMVLAGLQICFAGAGHAQVTVQNNGAAASNVSVVFDIANPGKIGTPPIHSTTTTDNNGALVNPLDISNAGKIRVDVYEEVCVDGKTQIVVVNEGQTPKDDGCKEKRKIGGGYIGGGYSLIVDDGAHTVHQQNPSTGMYGGRSRQNPGDYQRVEYFGGFTYFRESSENYIGYDATVFYNPSKVVGIGGEFTYLWQLSSPVNTSSSLYPYLFGLQLNDRKEKYNLFGHAMFGGVYARNSVTVGSITTTTSSNAFGMKLGGGIDFALSPHFALRPFEGDYFLTHFGGQVQNNFSYSGGLVIRF